MSTTELRKCPACNGSGETGREVKYQHVEGMAYMDAPQSCPHCCVPWVGSTGKVNEVQYEEICKELGLCEACGTEEGWKSIEKWGKCDSCLADAYDDEMFHQNR